MISTNDSTNDATGLVANSGFSSGQSILSFLTVTFSRAPAQRDRRARVLAVHPGVLSPR